MLIYIVLKQETILEEIFHYDDKVVREHEKNDQVKEASQV